ncbi:hypothetical protein KCU83_g569, partial [Aureobasidium melanogenum]
MAVKVSLCTHLPLTWKTPAIHVHKQSQLKLLSLFSCVAGWSTMEFTDLAHGKVEVIHLTALLGHFSNLKKIVYLIIAIRVALRHCEQSAESVSTSVSSCIGRKPTVNKVWCEGVNDRTCTAMTDSSLDSSHYETECQRLARSDARDGIREFSYNERMNDLLNENMKKYTAMSDKEVDESAHHLVVMDCFKLPDNRGDAIIPGTKHYRSDGTEPDTDHGANGVDSIIAGVTASRLLTGDSAPHSSRILELDQVGQIVGIIAKFAEVSNVLLGVVTKEDDVALFSVIFCDIFGILCAVGVLEAGSDCTGDILQINKLAFAELELVGAAADKLGVYVVFVLIDAEVASADALVPLLASLTGRNALEIAGVEGSETNLGDHVVVAFVGFNIDGDVDDIKVRVTCFLLCFLCGPRFAFVLSCIDGSIHITSKVRDMLWPSLIVSKTTEVRSAAAKTIEESVIAVLEREDKSAFRVVRHANRKARRYEDDGSFGLEVRETKAIEQNLQIPIAFPEFAAGKELDRDRLALRSLHVFVREFGDSVDGYELHAHGSSLTEIVRCAVSRGRSVGRCAQQCAACGRELARFVKCDLEVKAEVQRLHQLYALHNQQSNITILYKSSLVTKLLDGQLLESI